MKNYLPLLLLLLCSSAFSQKIMPDKKFPRFQLNTYIGYSSMTGLKKSMDETGGSMFGINFQYNIRLQPEKYYLSVGVGYEANRYSVDGLFTKNGNSYAFEQTPDNYKQNQLITEYLQFPVLFKFNAFKAASTGIGPYVGFLLNADSRYKIGDQNFRSNNVPIQNKFRAGIVFEQEFLLFSTGKSKISPILGYGLQYQLTNNLQGERSFKPLTGFIKLGFGF